MSTVQVTVIVPGQTDPVVLGPLPLTTTSAGVLKLINDQINVSCRAIDLLSHEREKEVLVTDGMNECDEDDGLRINRDTSLAQYYNNYLRATNDPLANNPAPVIYSNSSIQIGSLRIQAKRTIRVPIDNNPHFLPPDLGNFPLASVSAYAAQLPPAVVVGGGAIMPMYQNEAAWLNFEHLTSQPRYALKVSVGNINAITGSSKQQKGKDGIQDYVSTQQPWLDGVCTGPGIVRQFTAVPLGSPQSVEHQLTGRDKKGGIQMIGKFRLKEGAADIVGNELLKTPAEMGIVDGDSVVMLSRIFAPTANQPLSILAKYAVNGTLQLAAHNLLTMPIVIKNGKQEVTVQARPSSPISLLKTTLAKLVNVPQNQQKLTYDGASLDDNRSLNHYGISSYSLLKLKTVLRGGLAQSTGAGRTMMSMAAGGMITQSIYADETDPRAYDSAGTRAHLHVLNSREYEEVTGKAPPASPVSESTYRENGLPYFELYDEHVRAMNVDEAPSAALARVQPVSGDPQVGSHAQEVIGIQFDDLHNRDWVSPPSY